MIRLTFFLRSLDKPIVITTNEELGRVLRFVRRIMKKSDEALLEIQVDDDILYVQRKEVLACLVSVLDS